MVSTNPTYESLLGRRSAQAKSLVTPGPDREQLVAIVEAGARAPDHGRLVPFRFLHFPPDRRAALADVFEAAAFEENPDRQRMEIERSREKAMQGPELIALIARIDPAHPKIVASDQWLTVGCALENMLLALQSLGFAAAVRSGSYLETKAVRQAFGLAENEYATCLVAIGTAAEWPPVKPKPAVSAVLTVW